MSGYNSCMFAYGQVLVVSKNGILFIIVNKTRRKSFFDEVFVIVFTLSSVYLLLADW